MTDAFSDAWSEEARKAAAEARSGKTGKEGESGYSSRSTKSTGQREHELGLASKPKESKKPSYYGYDDRLDACQAALDGISARLDVVEKSA